MINGFLNEIKKRREKENLDLYKSLNENSRNNIKLHISRYEEQESNYKPIPTSYIKFGDLYKIYFKNIRKKSRNKKKKNKTIIKDTIDTDVRRRIMFTDSNYPISLRDDELGKGLEEQIFFKIISKPINIIEELDNEDIMMKFLPKNSFIIFQENYKFENLNNYKEMIDFFIENIENYHFSSINNKYTFYNLKKFGKEKIDLYLKSLTIKISKNDKVNYEFSLPLNIIPFFYSINYKDFIFFITKLISISDNKIIFNSDLIERSIKEIINKKLLFNKNSIFFETDKNLKYYLLFNDELYEFEILYPYIELIKENSIKIIKNAGKAFIYYLINNNFYNWGNLTLCYLSSFKDFRQYIYQIYQNKDEDMKVYNIDNLILSNTIYSKFKINDKSEKYFYFLSQFPNKNSNKIVFFRVYFYKVKVICGGKEYTYEMSYNDMKKLYLLQKEYNLDDIINKCLITDIKNEKVYFSLDLIKGHDINKNFFQHEKIHTILIKSPRIHWFENIHSERLNSNEIITETYNFNNELIESLINNPLQSFPFIFFNNLNIIFNEIEEQKHKQRIQFKQMNTMMVNSSKKESPKKKLLVRKKTISSDLKVINITNS